MVRGANWVGDAVMTVPALRELRRVLPRAHITLATRAWAEGIFQGADFLDDILVSVEAGGTALSTLRGADFLDEILISDETASAARSVLREARGWHARRFDLAVLFPNAFASALVAALARVPARVGYATQGRGPLLTHTLQVPDWRGLRHEVFYYLNIVAELERMLHGSSSLESNEPHTGLFVSDKRRRGARELLRGGGARLERPLVALCPGSTNSRAKRWPAERFAALADSLVERSGAEVVLIGAGEEMDVSEEVARRMRKRPVVLTGETDLGQTVAVLSVADLLVTNDTGPAHVAAAVGCPVVVIFGPTNPVTTRPLSMLSEVVRVPPDCAPCMLRDCPIDHRCMTAITAEDVYARAVRVLEARRGAEVAR